MNASAPSPSGNPDSPSTSQSTPKPKRVRTGCLTCRERHLKCDEGTPICQNCRKSARVCKRGVRLNFIDTSVKTPPVLLGGYGKSREWQVRFEDESRDIASEYKGGLEKYQAAEQPAVSPPLQQQQQQQQQPDMGMATRAQSTGFNHMQSLAALSTQDPRMTAHNALPPVLIQPGAPGLYPESGSLIRQLSQPGSIGAAANGAHSDSGSYHGGSTYAPSYAGHQEQVLTPATESREHLNQPEEVLFMQVFVEEVGLWMDSMDSMKHFSRLLPFSALAEPMLLNAFLACGARHLTLVNPAYHEDKALFYYDTATTQLLRALQNPARDTVVCATTAVILNVYEIMSERAMQRMNHIAGARALIKECGWNASSSGIGGACFWLNVGMELLSCLHFNWQVAWDPDQWNLDMNWTQGRADRQGEEEVWTHRMIYISAKVANFRASAPRFKEPNPQDEQIRLEKRQKEWETLRGLCDQWHAFIPRTMHPMAYLQPSQTTSKSTFPEVWLIKRATIMGRLFYHTAYTLLAQINPLQPLATSPNMAALQLQHAHQICGIVAHVKDRGVASAALRCMAIAAECLVARAEQEEVLKVFDKIKKETGWQIGFLYHELKEKWGWNREARLEAEAKEREARLSVQLPSAHMMQSGLYPGARGGVSGSTGGLPLASPPALPQLQVPPAAPERKMPPSGILNPLLKAADFSLPDHPYQQYYQPPSHVHNSSNIWS